MDPNELIKAAPELAKGAGAIAAAVPFTAIVKRMLGPAADELAEMLRDQVRLYRYERQIKCLEKAERMARDAGFTPQAVPPKILFPLLDGASMEDDDSLHDMWAALLANAASPRGRIVRPSFISLLKEMAPDEAWLLSGLDDLAVELDRMRDKRYKPAPDVIPRPFLDVPAAVPLMKKLQAKFCKLPEEDDLMAGARFRACLQGLEEAGLVISGEFAPRLTGRGTAFLFACRPPKPKENG
jgi:Abortive infection alpha